MNDNTRWADERKYDFLIPSRLLKSAETDRKFFSSYLQYYAINATDFIALKNYFLTKSRLVKNGIIMFWYVCRCDLLLGNTYIVCISRIHIAMLTKFYTTNTIHLKTEIHWFWVLTLVFNKRTTVDSKTNQG